jgi:wyosine [tRNA(Phe)-imidazoG37] synthetase (radical SAM superfamily)
MNILEPKRGCVYGPVQSRRLGTSLGINLLPRGVKVCSFDCVYCQYGWTHTLVSPGDPWNGHPLPTVSEVRQVLQEAFLRLKMVHGLPRYVTFSGNGEPTLHPRFAEMVDAVIRVRDETAPGVQTTILSNSSTVCSDTVREALLRLDLRIMKLDCGSPDCFRSFNKPSPGIDIEKITQGLVILSRQSSVILQSLFASGENGNLDEENIAQWRKRVSVIAPESVQIYTLHRGYPDEHLHPASAQQLEQVRSLVESLGIRALVF